MSTILAVRLAGRRRGEVLTRLRDFDVERVVPGPRLDDMHMLLDAQARREAADHRDPERSRAKQLEIEQRVDRVSCMPTV